MGSYVSADDLKSNGSYAGIISDIDIAPLSEYALNNLLTVGKEMIDAYCEKQFEGDVPSIVKLVNVQLVSACIQDMSKKAESVEDYSYTNNLSAFSNILSMLDFLKIDEESIAAKKKSVRARVI